MRHNVYSTQRKSWSTTISSAHEELIKAHTGAHKIEYTEQDETKQDPDPIYTVLDYSGIDALAIGKRPKEIHALSLRVTNWSRPQVTIRATEVDSWTKETNLLRPAYHIQLVQHKGHTRHMLIVNLNKFRSLPDPMQYLRKTPSNSDPDGYFYNFTEEGLRLPCVRILDF
jgi:hypothetical protein